MACKKLLSVIICGLLLGSVLFPQSTAFASQEDDMKLTVSLTEESIAESVSVSDLLYGIFLEDINYAADGGLYAELIKNRSFEYGTFASSGAKHGWAVTDSQSVSFEIVDGTSDGSCIHSNNPSYALITNSSAVPNGISNCGFLDGIAVTEGIPYRFSAFLRGINQYEGAVTIRLEDTSGTVYAEASIPSIRDEWIKYELDLIPSSSVSGRTLRLSVTIDCGSAAMDMISLFPSNTYKNRENGLREDLAKYLEALSPSFLRFPGGCAVEGRDEDSMYSWKDSIGNGETLMIQEAFVENNEIISEQTVSSVGDVAVRPQAVNIWKGTGTDPYYMTYGLGFYEYFLLCEDLNCLGIPILNAGMTCPIQSEAYQVYPLNSDEFAQCIQDALDLAEFCRGDETTVWGAVRIAMGHEEPFDLHYIGIGNEQWQTEYYQHFEAFSSAFQEAAQNNPKLYGDIELIVANGPSSGDRFAWNRIGNQKSEYAGLVDEHYYESPAWLKSNVNRYDSYDRDSVPVFLGEYAGKANTLQAALAEAAFMTGLEKNSDIVRMACYAPLFGNETTVQWSPDLIWFSNQSVYGSANYYIQKLFMNNVGTNYLPSSLTGAPVSDGFSGKVGLGTWATSASFEHLKVISNETGETLLEENFDGSPIESFEPIAGRFHMENNALIQSNTSYPLQETTGDVAYFGDCSWQNYTMTVTATKTGGAEGFLIPIAVQGKNNNVFWNIGGWNNTVSCLQIVTDGIKSGQIAGTVSNLHLTSHIPYELKVEVESASIRCYINDELVIDYTQEPAAAVFRSVCIDKDGSLLIKLVNTEDQIHPIAVSIDGWDEYSLSDKASVQTVTGASNEIKNTKSQPELISLTETSISVSKDFIFEMPALSASVIRIEKQK